MTIDRRERPILTTRRLAAVIAVATIMCGGLLAQTTTFKAPAPRFTDPDRRAKLTKAFPEIDALFQEFIAREHVPGAAWGIVIDGELAHAGAAGLRDVPAKSPVERDTAFRIASMTKSFTAMSVLKLRDEGKLSLDDPAERYVPEMKALLYRPTTRQKSPSGIFYLIPKGFQRTIRGAIGSLPTQTSSFRK